MMPSPAFAEAARDYQHLLDRGYPTKACLKLVGDRHRLDGNERMMLFRGILPSGQSSAQRKRILKDPAPFGGRADSGNPGSRGRVALDGYNIFFTIMNYLRGHSLFIATDGLLRDSGGARGIVADEEQFIKAMEETIHCLASFGPSKVLVYLDAPIPFSSRHASVIREKLSASGIDGEVLLLPCADPFVAAFEGDWAASADSVVAARAHSPIFDLARLVLESSCQASFTDFSDLFPESAA